MMPAALLVLVSLELVVQPASTASGASDARPLRARMQPVARQAQDAPGQPAASPALRLTLDEAIRRGLDTSHRVGEAVARNEGATASVDVRRAASLPQITAQGGY